MADVTQAWLKTNVGDPSGKWGSKYSDIYNVTGEYERKKAAGNKDQKLVAKLYKLVNAWSTSGHTGAATETAKDEKNRQQRQLNAFRAALQLEFMDGSDSFREDLLIKLNKANSTYPKELAMVRGVIAKMTQSSVPLIRNTGVGLEDVKIQIVLTEGQNGSWNRGPGVMYVNPCLAYNHCLLMGLLAHEYHHKLNDAPLEFLYLDEFVAHYKQFSITFPSMSEAAMVREVNNRLKLLYPRHVERWTTKKSPYDSGSMGMQLVENLAQVGDFMLPDNAAPRAAHARNHSCTPLA